MAKQKLPLAGIVAVVGLIALIFATSGGFFKNFSPVTNGLDVNIPDVKTVSNWGQQAIVDFTIQNVVNTDNYFSVTPYVDGKPLETYQYFTPAAMNYVIIFASNGVHHVYFHVVDNYDASIQADSNVMTAYVGTPGPTVTPMPHPNPTGNGYPTPKPTVPPPNQKNIVQQILDWINAIIQQIKDFFKSFGF